MVTAAVIAAAYLALSMVLAPISFGLVQMRLAEALTVLAALTPAAVPGLFLGCALANILNPASLGPIDWIGGSLTTLAAALLTRVLVRGLPPLSSARLFGDRAGSSRLKSVPVPDPSVSTACWPLGRLIWAISPAVWLNALVVGSYLPFLILRPPVTVWVVFGSIATVLLGQAGAVYLAGLPLLYALRHAVPQIGDQR